MWHVPFVNTLGGLTTYLGCSLPTWHLASALAPACSCLRFGKGEWRALLTLVAGIAIKLSEQASFQTSNTLRLLKHHLYLKGPYGIDLDVQIVQGMLSRVPRRRGPHKGAQVLLVPSDQAPIPLLSRDA